MHASWVCHLYLPMMFCQAMTCCPEGSCRTTPEGRVQICGSGYWQDTLVESYFCLEDHLVPSIVDTVPETSTKETSMFGTSTPYVSQSATSNEGTTGYWKCSGHPVPRGKDEFGLKSYRPNAAMASVYDAGSYVFRCDVPPPRSGYYAAVWTRYNANERTQQAPKNCNQWLTFTNPMNGRTAEGKVIDRCASCVGVNRQTSDPTTPDILVNGATVDLSPALWSELYNGAPYGVYDVEYNGSLYGGSWDGEPDALNTPLCS